MEFSDKSIRAESTILPNFMRALSPFDPITLDVERELGPQLLALARSREFKKNELYYSDYPPGSLLASRMRAFLSLLILGIKPELMLEIGTYRAGTSEVIARAMWSLGKGKLITIDPYGIANGAPEIIKGWPDNLPSFVEFIPEMSMQFFAETATKRRLKFDIIFIDGNHDYEFALHDIVMSAKFLKPGGVIVLDNAEQAGVLWAARHFMSLNPGWEEVTGTLEKLSPKNPFQLVDSPINSLVNEYAGWMGLVLIAPKYQAIGEKPVSFEIQLEGITQISGICIQLEQPANLGMLHAKTYLRTFRSDAAGEEFMPEELFTVSAQNVNPGETNIIIDLPCVLQSKIGSTQSIRKCEILLSWQSAAASDTLKLSAEPVLL